MLAESKGVRREAESEGSLRQNVAPMNKNRIRGTEIEMRRPTALKSDTYTDGLYVYAAVISVEVRVLPSDGNESGSELLIGEREIPGGQIQGNTLRVGVGNLPDVSEPCLSSITIYQLRVVLCGVSPLVWRRLLVASDTTIAELHEILQSAFDWGGEHLHRFLISLRPKSAR